MGSFYIKAGVSIGEFVPALLRAAKRGCARKMRGLCIAVVLMALCLPSTGLGGSEQHREVLVINSYHPTYRWTKRVMDGIESILQGYEGEIDLDVEYMDTKRFLGDRHYDNLYALYKCKARKRRYDVIIACDNNALAFVLRHRDELYPDVPIVFCGIDRYGGFVFEGQQFMTGVVEGEILEPTVEVALKLHPSAREVVLVRDKSEWSKHIDLEHRIGKIAQRFSERARVVSRFVLEPDTNELLRCIDGLGKESVVIFTSAFTTGEEPPFSSDVFPLIQQRCSAPIYTLTERWFNYAPIVGGKINSGFYQGQQAAKMAMRVLNGEDVRDIPIMWGGADKYVFDYVRLKRFGIAFSKLPEGSIIVNEPKSFYHLYKKRIWVVSGMVLALAAVVVVLSVNILRRRQAEKKLLDYQSQLKRLASELSLTEERERRRIATELHDQTAQSLVISKFKLETLRESVSSDSLAKVLNEICGLLDQSIRSTRSLTFDLSYPILYELGFEAAVAEWLNEQVRDKYGIASEFSDDGQPKPMNDDIRAILFRNVRELLINVVKHAHAHKVKVVSRRVNGHIRVSVEDDGVGFSPAQTAVRDAGMSGFGLFSIRERLEQLGGHLEIESKPGRGTRITITAPLREQEFGDRVQDEYKNFVGG